MTQPHKVVRGNKRTGMTLSFVVLYYLMGRLFGGRDRK
jgi:hypothetical protein